MTSHIKKKMSNLLNSSDTLSTIILHVHSTNALLTMRAACRTMRNAISLEHVLGMPRATAELFLTPSTEILGEGTLVWPDDIRGALVDQGHVLWAWAGLTPHGIHIDKYSMDGRGQWARTTSFVLSAPPNLTYIWSQVCDNGLICTVSENCYDETSPIVFSALTHEGAHDWTLHTEVSRDMLIDPGTKAPRCEDSLHCAFWKGRALLIVLAAGPERQIGTLQVEKDGGWEWWKIRVNHDTPKRWPMRQTGRKMHLMPTRGGVLFELDLEDEMPTPAVSFQLPVIPLESSAIRVQDTELLAQVESEHLDTLYHLSPHGARVVVRQSAISAFEFAGGVTAAAVFFEYSRTYAVYNLRTRDLVFMRRLLHAPAFVALTADTLWYAGPRMQMHRQTRKESQSASAAC